MSWFDDLFGGTSTQPAAPPAQPKPFAPASVQAQTAGFPDQATWLANYIKAQRDAAGARMLQQRGLINLFTGNDKNAAGENAAVNGPAEYFKQLSAQPEFNSANADAQQRQNGVVKDLAQTGLQTGQDVDPNNIPAILPAYTAAMRQAFPELTPGGDTTPSPQPAPAPQGATPFAPSLQPPVTVAPLPPPQANAGTPGNVPAIMRAANAVQSLAMPPPAPAAAPNAAPNAAPAGVPLAAPTAQMAPAAVASTLQKHRALLDLYARLDLFKGNATGAKALYDEAARGIPTGAAVDGRGNVVEGAQGGSLGGLTGGQFEAKNAGLVAGAKKDAEVPGTQKIDAARIAAEHAAKMAEIARAAQVKPYDGIDSGTGQPTITNDLNAATNPGSVVKTNPYFAGQQEEIKGLRTKAETADQGIGLGMRIVNAANGLYSGKGAGDLQDLRKLGQAVAAATGTELNPAWTAQTSQFEQLKFAAQQLVAVASHDLSPRVSQLIYQQIASVKAGDASSVKGLRDIVTKQILPPLMRDKAMLGSTTAYYKQHPLTNDAATVVPAQNPLDKYSVKTDLGSVQPGDYFLDPQSGNLRQRPAQ